MKDVAVSAGARLEPEIHMSGRRKKREHRENKGRNKTDKELAGTYSKGRRARVREQESL